MTLGPRPAFAAGQEEEWRRLHRRIFRFCKSFPLLWEHMACHVGPPPPTNEGAFP